MAVARFMMSKRYGLTVAVALSPALGLADDAVLSFRSIVLVYWKMKKEDTSSTEV